MDVREISISIFSKNDDLSSIESGLRALLPDELQKKEGIIKEQTAQGFNENTITILSVHITKKTETRLLLDHLREILTPERLLLAHQLDSRLDDELNFFIRLDREKWLHTQKPVLVDHGDCVHIKIGIVTYPKKRGQALVQLSAWLEAKDF